MVSALGMNYFDLFELPISFKPDLSLLKKNYYKLSFKHHPDHQLSDNISDTDKILDMSSLINKAYNTLLDENKCFEYILRIHDVLPEEGKAQIPQEFLIEMMDFNEQLMELEFNHDKEKIASLSLEADEYESKLYKSIEPVIKDYSFSSISKDSLQKLVDFYLKKKYLLRIKQNLLRFASA